MSSFSNLTCSECWSIVENITTSGDIIVTCTACNHTQKADSDDTLMAAGYINDVTAINDMYERTLRYAGSQPDNPKPSTPIKCPQCKKTENVRYVRLGTEEVRYFVCPCNSDGTSHVFTVNLAKNK